MTASHLSAPSKMAAGEALTAGTGSPLPKGATVKCAACWKRAAMPSAAGSASVTARWYCRAASSAGPGWSSTSATSGHWRRPPARARRHCPRARRRMRARASSASAAAPRWATGCDAAGRRRGLPPARARRTRAAMAAGRAWGPVATMPARAQRPNPTRCRPAWGISVVTACPGCARANAPRQARGPGAEAAGGGGGAWARRGRALSGRRQQSSNQGLARLESRPLFGGHPADEMHHCNTQCQETNMAIERTLSIIKPDAVAKNVIGQIYARFEAAGLKIVAARMVHLARPEAERFYAVHKERPFFKDLVELMISGPVMVQVLEGENAVLKNRELMGATDPKKAQTGPIRADFADSIDANAVHGSDAAETAQAEVAFFFPGLNIYPR